MPYSDKGFFVSFLLQPCEEDNAKSVLKVFLFRFRFDVYYFLVTHSARTFFLRPPNPNQKLKNPFAQDQDKKWQISITFWGVAFL